jgi:hypothetical protein
MTNEASARLSGTKSMIRTTLQSGLLVLLFAGATDAGAQLSCAGAASVGRLFALALERAILAELLLPSVR